MPDDGQATSAVALVPPGLQRRPQVESIGLPRSWALVKRAVDATLGLVLLLLSLPLMALVTLVVMATSRGPVLFAHTRIGQGGMPFRCLKFRTMVDKAEVHLGRLLTDPEVKASFLGNHKLEADPRVTRVGHFLRRTSLDELPQFWNVVRGDMSLVGPRPVVADEVERYGDARGHYLAMRPGVTGPWQVSGRSNTPFPQRVALDRTYVESWSLWRDVQILLKTVGAVVRCTGAR